MLLGLGCQGLAGCSGLGVLCLNWGSFCCCAACSFYVAGCVHHPFSLLADFTALFMWLGCSNCRDWQRGRAGLGCIPCRKERHQCCCCVAVLQMMLRYVYPGRSVCVWPTSCLNLCFALFVALSSCPLAM
jgi:hypothetical protein